MHIPPFTFSSTYSVLPMHYSREDFRMARASRLLPFGALLLFMLSLLWYAKSGDGLFYLKGHASSYGMNPAAGFKSPKDSTKDVHNSTLGVRIPLNRLTHPC